MNYTQEGRLSFCDAKFRTFYIDMSTIYRHFTFIVVNTYYKLLTCFSMAVEETVIMY